MSKPRLSGSVLVSAPDGLPLLRLRGDNMSWLDTLQEKWFTIFFVGLQWKQKPK